MTNTLSDFWWVRNKQNMPHAYTAPLLMTISGWVWRIRGKDARWQPGQKWATRELADEDGFPWVTTARVCIGYAEARCIFPRRMILLECAFWNSKLRYRLQRLLPVPHFSYE